MAAAAPVALVLAGCGQTAVGSSDQPATLTAPAASASSAALRSGSYDGQVEQTRYGPVQVAVTIAGRRLTATDTSGGFAQSLQSALSLAG